MRRGFVIVFAVAVGFSACARGAGPALADVPLPDLSRLDRSVRTQITDKRASVLATPDRAGATATEVGTAYGELGMLLHAAQFYEAAEPAYQNAAALLPSDPRWPHYRALLARARGQLPQAIAHLTRTLELRGNDVPALVWLGRTYLDQGQPDQAEPFFARARDAAPRGPPVSSKRRSPPIRAPNGKLLPTIQFWLVPSASLTPESDRAACRR